MATDRAAQNVGAWLHNVVTGAAAKAAQFEDWRQAQPTLPQGIAALAHGIASGEQAPGPAQPTMQTALNAPPAYYAPAAIQAHAHNQAMAARDIAGLGQLSPAARAVLQAHSPITLAAVDAKAPKAPSGKAGADPTAGMGNLSFRQLLALSEAADHLSPRGAAARPPSASDAAGAMYIQSQKALLDQAMEGAKGDPARQAALQLNFNEKVLKPIALKGNTADEYLYGEH